MRLIHRYLYWRLIKNRDSYLRYPAKVLGRLGFSPTLLNLAGLIFGILASLAIIRNWAGAAFMFLLLSSVADALDGPLARETKTASRWGGVLDATCDRIVDLTIYFAISIRSIMDENLMFATLSWLNLLGATLTSYIRARAEANFPGKYFNIGILPRPGRLILLLIGLLHPSLLAVCMSMSAFLSAITVFQRLRAAYHIYRTEMMGENGSIDEKDRLL